MTLTPQLRNSYKDLELGSNPKSDDIAAELHSAIESSSERISQRLKNSLNLNNIQEKVNMERQSLSAALATEDWRKHFRGRDILRKFAGQYLPGMRYEYFRGLIISQMVNANFQPAGMKAVLDQILTD